MSGVSATPRLPTFTSASPAADGGAVVGDMSGLSFVDILSGQMDVAGLFGKFLAINPLEAGESPGSGPLPESIDPALMDSLGLTDVPTALPVAIPVLADAAETAAERQDGLVRLRTPLQPGAGPRADQGVPALSVEEGGDAASRSPATPAILAATDTAEDAAIVASMPADAKSAVATRLLAAAPAVHDPAGIASAALQASAAVAPAHAALSQTGAAHEFRIVAPLGGDRWTSTIGDSLIIMTGQQQNRAELVLTPPQLGRVEVSLTMTGDQANALFVSANPAVREVLESALPRLRELLADAGIVLNSQVGSELPRNASNNDARDAPAGRPASGDDTPGRTLSLAIATGAAGATRSGRGLVDVFA